ncbi:ribosome assembly factor SBDS [Candidatus Woesearchaeota archaeon]|nr:MAG: ribosome assembly factor SBDS [Candidatus Woesearchaeota archaeon]
MNIARLRKGSDKFEIVIDPEVAIRARKDPNMVGDALVHPQIYSDAKKGNLASEQTLKKVFKTTDPVEIAKVIIQQGDVQVTSEYRKSQIEQKKRKIIDYIHRNGIDPRTNAPHPIARIEAALDEAKVRIDEHKPAEQQVQDVIKALRPVLPIKFVVKDVDVIIPAAEAGKAYPQVKSFGKLLKDEWLNDGSWHAVIEIPGGIVEEFLDLVNKVTKGDAQAKIIATRG